MNELFPFANYEIWIALWTANGIFSMFLLDLMVEDFVINQQIHRGLREDDSTDTFTPKRLIWACILGPLGGLFLTALVFVAAISLKIQGDRAYRGFSHDLK